MKKITTKKEKINLPKKLVDIVRFTHKEITVDVKIDYIYNKISLVEWHDYHNKKWLFAERWVEYMNWWLNTLEAQKYAIEQAKIMYEKELAESSKFDKEKIKKFIIGKDWFKNLYWSKPD